MAESEIQLGQLLNDWLDQLANAPETDLQSVNEKVLVEAKLYFPDTFDQLNRNHALGADDPVKLKDKLYESLQALKRRPAHINEGARADAQVTPQEVAEQTRSFQKASGDASRRVTEKETRVARLRAEYAREVARNYTRQVRRVVEEGRAREAAEVVVREVEAAEKRAHQIPETLKTTEEAEGAISSAVSAVSSLPKKDQASLFKSALAEAKAARDAYDAGARQLSRSRVVLASAREAYFTDPAPTKNPDVLFEKALTLAETTTDTEATIVRMATSHARAGDVVTANTDGVIPGGHGFFRAIASTPIERVVAQVADPLFDSLDVSHQVRVIQDVVEKSFARAEKLESGVAKATEAGGGSVASLREFQEIIRGGDRDVSGRAGVTAAVSKAGGLTGSIFSSFGGIDPEAVIAMNEARLRIGATGYGGRPSSTSMYAYVIYPQLSTVFRGLQERFATWALKSGAKELGKEAVKKTIGAAIGKAAGGLIASAFGPGATPIGVFLGDVVLGKAIDFVVNAGKTMLYVGGGFIGDLVQGKPIDSRSFIVVLPWLIVIIIPILFILPTPLNFQSFPEDMRRLALVTSLGGGGPEGAPTDCAADPNDPVCVFAECEGDCAWPTDGIITQGPHPACGSHAGGEDENAIDIASSGNPTVYAMLDGTVTDVNTGCTDNAGTMSPDDTINRLCGRGYGNYVTITGTKNGKEYTIIFGHLLSNIPVSFGQSVTPKTPIGKMDHTGYSSGAHLHFGVLSGGNVLDLVPDNDPVSKADVYGCNSSCTKACPTTPVSASGL